MSDAFQRDIEAAIDSDEPDELLSAVIDIALAAEDPAWATEKLLTLADHPETDVRGNALIGFTHLAARFPSLDRARILPVIRAATRDSERHVREQAEAALAELEPGDAAEGGAEVPSDAAVAAFTSLHAGLPQQGPGSRASTERALAALAPIAAAPRLLDLGCGPGRQTLDLVRATGGRATAIDLLPGFVAELGERAAAAGLADRVTALQGSMLALGGLPDAGFDLVWSEGAIYNVGFERGLAHWRRLVAPDGAVAVTEASWLVEAPPAPARAFFAAGYPEMGDVATNAARAARAGFRVVETFALPDADWWDGYYTPLAERVEAGLAADPEPAVRAVLESTREEIALRRDFGDAYGYVFYLLRPA